MVVTACQSGHGKAGGTRGIREWARLWSRVWAGLVGAVTDVCGGHGCGCRCGWRACVAGMRTGTHGGYGCAGEGIQTVNTWSPTWVGRYHCSSKRGVLMFDLSDRMGVTKELC